jgi:hypothetical protein
MCKCFEENLVKIKEHIAPQIPEGAIDVDVDWDGMAFRLGGGDYSLVNPKIKVEFRAPKKGGGHAANLKKDTVTIFVSHCGFCGRKYEASKQEG